MAAGLLQEPIAAAAVGGEFPFELKEGLIWVKVRTPGSAEPLNFLLDSGASASVINLRTAERLGLTLGNRVSVQGVGTSTGGFWPEHLCATAGDVRLPTTYLAVDLSALSGACECRVDGLLGFDFFKGRVVQVDFADGKIRVLAGMPAASGQNVLPLRVRPGALRVPVRVNGGKAQWVRLDTGCAAGLQWVAESAAAEGHERRMAVALSMLSGAVSRSRVQLGEACFEDVATDLHQKRIFPDEAGLLGNGLLSRFGLVTINAKAGRLMLDPSRGGN